MQAVTENKTACEYCCEEMPFHKMYMTTLDHTDEDYFKRVIAHGHKYCMMAMKNAYNRFGKIMTQAEAEYEQFDAMI